MGPIEVDPDDIFEIPPDLIVRSDKEKPLSLADALKLGSSLEFLRRAARHHEEYELGDPDGDKVLGALLQIEQALKSSDVDSAVIEQVARFRSELIERYPENASTITESDSRRLEQKAITWTHLLQEDLKREQRIPVANTGLLDVDQLIESPEELFDQFVWDWLDQRPKEDVREACKTIVVGCSTSSVMLSLRAVEHCLREWYEQEHEPLEAAWGRVLDQLMERYAQDDKKADTVLTQLSDLPPVLSNLYYLKGKRNEVNHPEKSPSDQEARRTLMIVASTITDIYLEMHDVKESELGTINVAPIGEDTALSDVLLEVIYEMERNNDDDPVPISAVYDFAEGLDVSEEEVKDSVQTLFMQGRIYEHEHGMIRST